MNFPIFVTQRAYLIQMLNEDREYVDSLRRDDFSAFDALFKKYSGKLYAFAISITKEPYIAEEITQMVFMKIWEKRADIKNDKSFQSYLFTIAFNAIKKKFNQKMMAEKYKHDLFEWLSQEKPSLESRLDFEILLNKLDQLIDQLPEKRKEIFLKRKKEGKSIDTIAMEMDISPKTVKNQITEAMKFLKKSFAGDDASSLLFYYLFIS